MRYLRREVVGISVTCTYVICDAMKAARLGTDVSANSIISVAGAYPSPIPEETLRERRGIDLIREVFGSLLWLQETYRSLEDYLKGRGRPLASGL